MKIIAHLSLFSALLTLSCNDPNRKDHPDMNKNLNETNATDDISGNTKGAFSADTTSSGGAVTDSMHNAISDSVPHLK
jgi:hypothetical protein